MRAHRALRVCAQWTLFREPGWVQRVGEQSIALRFDNLVAFANPGLEAGADDDRDMAAFVTNQPKFLETMRRHGDTLPAYAEHVGNQLLSHDQFIRLESVVAQQQLLLNRVQPVANRSLRHLGE